MVCQKLRYVLVLKGKLRHSQKKAKEAFEKGVQDIGLSWEHCSGEEDNEDSDITICSDTDSTPSELDEFATELQAQADACSTVGSFARRPSTTRAVSEVASMLNDGNGKLRDTAVVHRRASSRSRREHILISDSEEEIQVYRAKKRRISYLPMRTGGIPRYGDRHAGARKRLIRQRSSLISSSRSPRKFFRD